MYLGFLKSTHKKSIYETKIELEQSTQFYLFKQQLAYGSLQAQSFFLWQTSQWPWIFFNGYDLVEFQQFWKT